MVFKFGYVVVINFFLPCFLNHCQILSYGLWYKKHRRHQHHFLSDLHTARRRLGHLSSSWAVTMSWNIPPKWCCSISVRWLTSNRHSLTCIEAVSLQYEKRTIHGKAPSGRGHHATVVADSRLFVIGGANGQGAFEDVYILDLAAAAYLPQVTNFTMNGDV